MNEQAIDNAQIKAEGQDAVTVDDPDDQKISKPTAEDESISDDQKLFDSICGIFQPLRYWLNEYDLGGGVKDSLFDPLFDFVNSWDDPFQEFMDKGLEAERIKLIDVLQDFHSDFGLCMSLSGNHFFPTIHFANAEYRPEEKQEELRDELRTLNVKACDVWHAYQEFVRACRRRGMKIGR